MVLPPSDLMGIVSVTITDGKFSQIQIFNSILHLFLLELEQILILSHTGLSVALFSIESAEPT